MTDGPFRNAELSSRWKQYGRDLVSDAASADERTLQACHSMVGDAHHLYVAMTRGSRQLVIFSQSPILG